MKALFLFVLFYSLCECFVVKEPEHRVISHMLANSGIAFLCSRRGDRIR